MKSVNSSHERSFIISLPYYLQTLLRPVQFIKGVGPHLSQAFERLSLYTLWDLLSHLPTSVHHRTYLESVSSKWVGQKVTVVLTPHHHHKGNPRKRTPYRIACHDGQGAPVDLIFFHMYPALVQQMPCEIPRVVSGDLDYFMGIARMVHPDHMGPLETVQAWSGSYPQYPLTYGITQKQMRQAIIGGLSQLPKIPEWLPDEWIHAENLQKCENALQSLHIQATDAVLSPMSAPRRRLAYDELFAYSLALYKVRAFDGCQEGYVLKASSIPTMLFQALPFELTGDQRRVTEDIFNEMCQGVRMVRLLQGDVGSGKTAVAFMMLALIALEGVQGALMAPTEILARQHALTLRPWVEALGLKMVILTGQDKGKARDKILKEIAEGSAHLVIGTHALFQEDVCFHALKGVVIDEQHRFGVEQRLRLLKKGQGVHLLSMTATPIPRTLLLTLHGDLQVSVLREKPAHRKAVITSVISSQKRQELFESLPRALAQGHKIFWVCPLVEDSEALNLTSVETRFKELQQVLGESVGLVHGKLKGSQKEAVVQRFKEGQLQVLVTTTVVEVGVDVPDATLMIIEHAERYGLAQLHQLRGRIGRGERPGTCILLYSYPISAIGRERLDILKHSNDGFELAEADLRLRGGGELAGYKQSGVPDFKFADLSFHQEILKKTSEKAKEIITNDPSLLQANHQNLKDLLILFGHDATLNVVTSG